jgi:hypothetical protein
MPTLTDWAWITTMLVQALVGVITPNYRMINLAYEDSAWKIEFYVHKEDAEDRENIQFAVEDFGAWMGDIEQFVTKRAITQVRHEIIVGSGPMNETQTETRRTIFKHRETR